MSLRSWGNPFSHGKADKRLGLASFEVFVWSSHMVSGFRISSSLCMIAIGLSGEHGGMKA